MELKNYCKSVKHLQWLLKTISGLKEKQKPEEIYWKPLF